MKKIILASASPRRRELMEMLGYDFEVIVSDVDETLRKGLSPAGQVKDLAYRKARAVFDQHRDAIVIGADTIVLVDDRILGKPHSEKEAEEMMKLLRGREHLVITGVAVLCDRKEHHFSEESKVFFENITNEEIARYVRTAEPYDKAGAYAIQGWAGRYISRIEGDYYNIVGLPVSKLYGKLKRMERL
ncbi:MAG: septum formation inhibitor Maf [Erysipelotrichaceae bacterium]|nr:septum formation inhibitor Maf [Erysipelotrichaceae bacterium]